MRRARELRESSASLNSLALFSGLCGTFDYQTAFEYNYVRKSKEATIWANSKFIEEFYYWNNDPQARSTKQNKAVQKQTEELMLNDENNGLWYKLQGDYYIPCLESQVSGSNIQEFIDSSPHYSEKS